MDSIDRAHNTDQEPILFQDVEKSFKLIWAALVTAASIVALGLLLCGLWLVI